MKKPAIRIFLTTGLVLTLTTGIHAAVGSANEHPWEDDDHPYDRARRAVDRGEALPIAKLLERLRDEVPGEVIGVEFEREHGRWVYEFKVIDNGGHLREVYVDAHTGRVLSMEEN